LEHADEVTKMNIELGAELLKTYEELEIEKCKNKKE
jgi:hypothetical protein